MVWTSPHVPIHPVIPVVLNSAKFCCKSKTEYPIATQKKRAKLFFFFANTLKRTWKSVWQSISKFLPLAWLLQRDTTRDGKYYSHVNYRVSSLRLFIKSRLHNWHGYNICRPLLCPVAKAKQAAKT